MSAAMHLLLAEADLASQLALLAAWGALWYVIIDLLATRAFRPFLLSRAWLAQWKDLTRNFFETSLQVEFASDELFFDYACQFSAITCQHGVGGLLCVPAMCGFSGPVACALVRHGALCEAGWEFQDILQRAWQVKFGGEEGKAKNQSSLLAAVALHHALGLCMVIPMNLAYGGHPCYHEIVFLLQGAAFFALLMQNYSFTLDVRTSTGLRRMRLSTGSVFVVLCWSRLYRFWVIGYRMMCTFYADGNTAIFSMASPGLVLMGIFNAVIVGHAFRKCLKFMLMRLPLQDMKPIHVATNAECARKRCGAPTMEETAQ